ncbi:hypothetical protein M758_7G106700 [Ceratodon purpureus]|nr:hypothetical protein M758_7G106700 [Ceratodon purpureus]
MPWPRDIIPSNCNHPHQILDQDMLMLRRWSQKMKPPLAEKCSSWISTLAIPSEALHEWQDLQHHHSITDFWCSLSPTTCPCLIC